MQPAELSATSRPVSDCFQPQGPPLPIPSRHQRGMHNTLKLRTLHVNLLIHFPAGGFGTAHNLSEPRFCPLGRYHHFPGQRTRQRAAGEQGFSVPPTVVSRAPPRQHLQARSGASSGEEPGVPRVAGGGQQRPPQFRRPGKGALAAGRGGGRTRKCSAGVASAAEPRTGAEVGGRLCPAAEPRELRAVGPRAGVRVSGPPSPPPRPRRRKADLFIHERRERQRHRQREKQAPYQGPDAGLDPGTPGSRPEPKADAQPLSHPGVTGTWLHRPASGNKLFELKPHLGCCL